MAGAHGRADRSGDQEGARRRDHQGRRPHRQAEARRSPTSPSFPACPTIPASSSTATSTKNGDDLVKHPIGTGPFELVSYEVGKKAVFKRRENGKWWGGEAYLDGVEFIDYGTDPSAMVSAFEAGEVDCQLRDRRPTMSTILDKAGPGEVRGRRPRRRSSRAPTSSTSPTTTRGCATRCRWRSTTRPSCKLGYRRCAARSARTTMSARSIRNMTSCRRSRATSPGAKELMTEAGQIDFEHELITSRRGMAQEHRRRDRRAAARGRHQGEAHRAAGLDLLERLDEVSLSR